MGHLNDIGYLTTLPFNLLRSILVDKLNNSQIQTGVLED